MTFVVGEHELRALPEFRQVTQQPMTDVHVPTHLGLLVRVERAGLEQHGVVRSDLADVVHACGVADQLDLRVLELEPPREALRERGDALRVAVRIWIAEIDEVRQLEDRRARLLANPRAVAQRDEHRDHRDREQHERERLPLRGHRGDGTEEVEAGHLRQVAPVQRPPRREGAPLHLQCDGDVDERGLGEVTGRAGREDRHGLRQHRPRAVGESKVDDRRAAGGDRGHRGGERAVVPGHPRVPEVKPGQRADGGHEHREERTEQERRGEEWRVVDGQLDLERQVDGPDLGECREPEKDADDEQVLGLVHPRAECGQKERRRPREDHASDIGP